MKQVTFNIELNDRDFNDRIIGYQQEGLDFELSRTNYTASVKFKKEGIKYFASVEDTQLKTLALMQKVKSHIKKQPKVIDLPCYTPDKIQYFKFNSSLYDFKITAGCYEEIEDVTEVDISAAYATAFLKHGFISPEIHRQITQLPKSDRLKVLGAIATNKEVTTYVKGKPVKKVVLNDPILRNCWFYIVGVIDNVMQGAYNEVRQNALFYYVDGIYLKHCDKAAQAVCDYFKAAGYGFKCTYFDKIAVLNTGSSLKIAVPTDKRIKLFTIPQRKIISYNLI